MRTMSLRWVDFKKKMIHNPHAHNPTSAYNLDKLDDGNEKDDNGRKFDTEVDTEGAGLF